MAGSAAATSAQQQQGCCACTLPFSLHLTVMIMGIVGMILGVVVVIVTRDIVNCWALITGALAFASGLQGLLVQPGSGCFACHVALAVINLVNLGVFGVACLFLISPFWVIWAIAAFSLELWVTISRYCCKRAGGVQGVATELPVAQPNVVLVVPGPPPGVVPEGYNSYPHGGYKYPPRPW